MSHPQEKQIGLPPWATASQPGSQPAPSQGQPLPTPIPPAQQQWHYSSPPVVNTITAAAASASAALPQPRQDYASYYQHQYPVQQQQHQSHDQQAYYNQYYQQQYTNNNPPPPGMEGPPGVNQPTTQPNYNYNYNQYGHYQQPAYSSAPHASSAQQNYLYYQQQQQQPQQSYYSQPQQQAHQPQRPPQQAPPPWSRQPVQRQAPLPQPVTQAKYLPTPPAPSNRGVIQVSVLPPAQQQNQPPPVQQQHQPPPPAPQTVKTESEKANEAAAMSTEAWPASLQTYVQDVFANVLPDRRAQAETQLRNLILEAHNAGTLMTTDWSEVDLPSACKPQSKKKKKKTKKLAALQNKKNNNEHQQRNQGTVGNPEEEQKRLRRLRRFEEDAAQFRADNVSTPLQAMHLDGNDFNNYTVVGTSTKLEKQYLRLTSAPDPATVRPLHILRQTLDLLRNKWRAEQNYTYICDQFKSMRQDLTVQRIKNEFTVEVYEIHARIALEKSDLGEYNQCQTQLKGLYKSGIGGSEMEFTAYRILYFLHTQNWADVNSTMANLTAEQKQNEFVQHALNVRSSLATANFHQFFKLYKLAPNMGAYLMDHFVERERVQSLIILCKACRPDLPLDFIERELGYESQEELFKFLTEQKAKTLKANSDKLLDTRAALIGLQESLKKYKKIDIKGQL